MGESMNVRCFLRTPIKINFDAKKCVGKIKRVTASRLHVVGGDLGELEQSAAAGAGVDLHLHDAAQPVKRASLGTDLGHVAPVLALSLQARRAVPTIKQLNYCGKRFHYFYCYSTQNLLDNGFLVNLATRRDGRAQRDLRLRVILLAVHGFLVLDSITPVTH